MKAALTKQSYLERLCERVCLGLVFLLPFCILPDTFASVELQGTLLIIAGGFAWVALLLGSLGFRTRINSVTFFGVLALAAAGLVSTFFNPHTTYSLFGSPYLRLGILGLLSCFGCGFIVARIPLPKLTVALYIWLTVMALVSIPYNMFVLHNPARFAGIAAQADVTACLLAVGLILGTLAYNLLPAWRKVIAINQLGMSLLLILTQTRMIIFLVVIAAFIWLYYRKTAATTRGRLLLTLIAAGIFVVMLLPTQRLTDTSYAKESVLYRKDLQSFAFSSGTENILTGYGMGNLSDALACHKSMPNSLQNSCYEGYFFDSSHNIFIDRYLGLGLLGGIAYLILVCYGMRGLMRRTSTRTLAYATLLISIYYLTNVTHVVLELLFCILLAIGLSQQKTARRPSRA